MTKYIALICIMIISGSAAAAGRKVTIESIDITGTRFPALVRSQMHLIEGRDYTEDELRLAVNRVVRLPFVLDAQSSLERGTTRGSYVFRVTVVPTENWSYYVGTDFSRHKDYSGTHSRDDFDFGYRKFLGKGGVLFAGVSPGWQWSDDLPQDDASYRLGYAQYDLFGRGVFASLSFDIVGSDRADGGFQQRYKRYHSVSPTFEVGVPLRGDHWVRGTYRYASVDYRGLGNPQINNYDSEDWRLFWEYNTTDDQFLPTTGRLVSAGIKGGYYESQGRTYIYDGTESTLFTSRTKGSNRTPFVSYQAYHAMRERHSIGYFVSAERTEFDSYLRGGQEGEDYLHISENTGRGWRLEGRGHYSFDLWGRARTRAIGDLRLEFDGVYRWSETDRSSEAYNLSEGGRFSSTERAHETSLRAAVAFRHGWGVARVSFNYIADDDYSETPHFGVQ